MSEHATHQMHDNSLAAHAEENAAGKLGWRAYRIMQTYIAVGGPLSDREVMRALGFNDMNSVRPRITELLAAGLLVETGSINDPVTGKTCRLATVAKGAIWHHEALTK